MAKCELCDKGVKFGRKISITRSHVSRRSNHMQKPNVKRVKIDINGTVQRMNLCTRCIRTGKANKIRS